MDPNPPKKQQQNATECLPGTSFSQAVLFRDKTSKLIITIGA